MKHDNENEEPRKNHHLNDLPTPGRSSSSGSFTSFAKLCERPTILDSHSDKVLKDFIDQSETKRCTKKLKWLVKLKLH